MTDLLKALDEAAAKLLAQAGLSEITPEKIEATPSERVKAFDSVLDYAKIRPTLVAQEPKESAFDAIKRGFDDGAKTERRGRPRKVTPPADLPAANGDGGAVDDSLFDAGPSVGV